MAAPDVETTERIDGQRLAGVSGYLPNELNPSQSSGVAGSVGSAKPHDCGATHRRFIAYSGGVESTTMVLMFGHMATPLFADTGWEHKPLYEWLEKVEAVTGVKIERVQRSETLPNYIKRSRYFPSPMARFCTRMFKIEPMDEYLSRYVPCELMIGLNYDERDMREGNHEMQPGVIYSYPLVDLKITRSMCEAVLNERGLHPKFPGYMRRGGCKGCFYKSKKEYYRMAKEAPEEAYSVADLEDAIQDGREVHFGVRDGIPNMRNFLDNARAQMELKLDDELDLKTSPCGVFCHR